MSNTNSRVVLVSLPIRIWHFVHGICIVLLVLTGIQLRYPDLFPLFGTVRKTVHLHNLFGFIATADYFLWFLYYVIKREMALHYIPRIKDFSEGTMRQAQHYFFRIFLGDPAPFQPSPGDKFNSLQKITYAGIMLFILPLQIITGILLVDLEFFLTVIAALGGVRVIDAFHVILAYVFTSFLIMHLYLATLGHTFFAHFKMIILGYEEKPH
jgi:thiosulfate reductase cytochrome b subunit